MRRSWILAVPILLLAAAVSGEPSKSSAAAAFCPAAAASAVDQGLPQVQPAPLFMTNYVCGTCSGECSGLLTGTPCGADSGQYGVCIGYTMPNGQRLRCNAPDTGYVCTCTA